MTLRVISVFESALTGFSDGTMFEEGNFDLFRRPFWSTFSWNFDAVISVLESALTGLSGGSGYQIT
jgi:tryptophan-rich sensory protein